MIFTGTSEHNLDAKQRLAIPAKHRYWGDSPPPAWYCIPLTNGPLRLYTETTFNKLAEQGGDSLTPDESVAEYETTFFGSAERLEMDSAQRLVLPKAHLSRAGIEPAGGTQVVLIGARFRLEIWDLARWRAAEDDRHARLPSLMQRIEQGRKLGQG